MRSLVVAVMLLGLVGCQSQQVDMAKRRADADKAQDDQCKSWGAKVGSPAYIQCRETLLGQAKQEDMQRRQMAMTYLATHPFN